MTCYSTLVERESHTKIETSPESVADLNDSGKLQSKMRNIFYNTSVTLKRVTPC